MIKYNLYLGLNDKDTKKQELNTVDAYKIATNLTTKYFEGATISECLGVFTHVDGTTVKENTLHILIIESEDQSMKIKQLANDLKITFNQESIMLDIIKENDIQFI